MDQQIIDDLASGFQEQAVYIKRCPVATRLYYNAELRDSIVMVATVINKYNPDAVNQFYKDAGYQGEHPWHPTRELRPNLEKSKATMECPTSPARDLECQRHPKPHDGQHENYDYHKAWIGEGDHPWRASLRWEALAPERYIPR